MVFAGLINTHVIKAPEIPGGIAPTITPSPKKFAGEEEIRLVGRDRCGQVLIHKQETPQDGDLQGPDDTTQVGQTQPIDTTAVNSQTNELEELSEFAESPKQHH